MTSQEQQEHRKRRMGEFESITYVYSAEPGQTIPFAFRYTGDISDIHCLQPSCGCTTVKMEGNIIKGELEIDAYEKLFQPGDPRLHTLLTRSISVYFDKNEPFYEVDNDLIRKVNPDKIQVALTIQGSIINPKVAKPA